MAVRPQLGALTFDEGDGTPQKQCAESTLFGNPAGGGPGAVIVGSRGKPFPAQLRGLFAVIPDVRALTGTIAVYVKDGQTVSVYVQEAEITRKSEVWAEDAAWFHITASFVLVPLT